MHGAKQQKVRICPWLFQGIHRLVKLTWIWQTFRHKLDSVDSEGKNIISCSPVYIWKSQHPPTFSPSDMVVILISATATGYYSNQYWEEYLQVEWSIENISNVESFRNYRTFFFVSYFTILQIFYV